MSKRTRIIRIIIYVFMVSMLVLLGVQYSSLPKGAESLTVFINGGSAGDSFTMYGGEEAALDYRITPKAFADRKTSMMVEDESVAFINGEGKLVALNEGQTVLVAEGAGLTKAIEIIVEDPVVSIKGFSTDVTVDLGDSYTIEPKVKMAVKGMEAPKLIYESSDDSVVKVNKKGKVTAVGYGTANVTVKAGKKEKKIIVRVREPEMEPMDHDTGTDADADAGAADNANTNAADNEDSNIEQAAINFWRIWP